MKLKRRKYDVEGDQVTNVAVAVAVIVVIFLRRQMSLPPKFLSAAQILPKSR